MRADYRLDSVGISFPDLQTTSVGRFLGLKLPRLGSESSHEIESLLRQQRNYVQITIPIAALWFVATARPPVTV